MCVHMDVFSTDYMYPKFNGLSPLTSKPYFISKLNFDAIPGMIVVGAAYVMIGYIGCTLDACWYGPFP